MVDADALPKSTNGLNITSRSHLKTSLGTLNVPTKERPRNDADCDKKFDVQSTETSAECRTSSGHRLELSNAFLSRVNATTLPNFTNGLGTTSRSHIKVSSFSSA